MEDDSGRLVAGRISSSPGSVGRSLLIDDKFESQAWITAAAAKKLEGVLEALEKWARCQPTKLYATWLEGDGKASSTYTYKELHQSVEILASHLSSRLEIKAGQTVLLVYPPCLDFIIAFLACLRAGIIPVPVFPPGK